MHLQFALKLYLPRTQFYPFTHLLSTVLGGFLFILPVINHFLKSWLHKNLSTKSVKHKAHHQPPPPAGAWTGPSQWGSPRCWYMSVVGLWRWSLSRYTWLGSPGTSSRWKISLSHSPRIQSFQKTGKICIPFPCLRSTLFRCFWSILIFHIFHKHPHLGAFSSSWHTSPSWPGWHSGTQTRQRPSSFRLLNACFLGQIVLYIRLRLLQLDGVLSIGFKKSKFISLNAKCRHLNEPPIRSVKVWVLPVGHCPVEEAIHGVDVHVQVLGRLHDEMDVPLTGLQKRDIYFQ